MRLHHRTISVFMIGLEAHLLLTPDTGMENAAGRTAFPYSMSTKDAPPPPEEGDASLNEAAADEREYVRRRLRAELKREPSEEEVDEWLRQHTEGY